ncbi:hypothetical protein [Enterobacter hormaechei]|uniref:hypothetical protein n=1 Tax=Enterobacter hormaechei TaxID=158836 RepID=UPI0013FD64F5|nr:hypothetical protein [Enterobacter hormaechei]
MHIKKAVQDFVIKFNMNELNMGRVDYTDVENETSFPVSLTGEIEFFYRHLILNDSPAFDGTFFLQIIEAQELSEVLSGWRVQNDTTWHDEYITFAERNGDILFCETKNITSPVYGSIQKRNFIISGSLAEFLDVFCSAIEIEQSKYDGDATDDDFNFREDFLEDIDLMLKRKLKDVEVQGFKKFFFG